MSDVPAEADEAEDDAEQAPPLSMTTRAALLDADTKLIAPPVPRRTRKQTRAEGK